MNQLQAMRDTVAKMEAGLQWLAEGGDATGAEKMHIERLDPDLQPAHIRDMLVVMESGVNPQDTERGFGDAKLGRWLGWAQAAVVAQGLMTLDDMKDINRANADAPVPVGEPILITARLHDVRRVVEGEDSRAPCLNGNIVGDIRGRFRDETRVTTSTILEELPGDIFRTRNSVYRVTSWADQ